jgi:hypothetical protein
MALGWHIDIETTPVEVNGPKSRLMVLRDTTN